MMCTGEEVSSVKEEERSKDSPHLRIVITRQPPVEVFSVLEEKKLENNAKNSVHFVLSARPKGSTRTPLGPVR